MKVVSVSSIFLKFLYRSELHLRMKFPVATRAAAADYFPVFRAIASLAGFLSNVMPFTQSISVDDG